MKNMSNLSRGTQVHVSLLCHVCGVAVMIVKIIGRDYRVYSFIRLLSRNHNGLDVIFFQCLEPCNIIQYRCLIRCRHLPIGR